MLDLFQISNNETQLKTTIGDYFDNDQFITTKKAHQAAVDEVEARLIQTINRENQKQQITKLWPRMAAVAAAIVIMVLGVYFFNYNKSGQNSNATHFAQDIAPGTQGATLTLASGRQIRISSAANGEIAKEAGIKVIKTTDGQLIYEIKERTTGNNQTNTLSTAKGETYILTLPDKSQVWLNAASTLTYAANLTSGKERRVKLQGEAYFQITKDKTRPFIVETQRQEIQVLGTHFNVKAYSDEPTIKTTLVEGSVQVKNNHSTETLKPGQQAVLTQAGRFEIGQADQVLDLAWKNNEFMFESESIQNVMKMVERWYNVEIIYQGEITTEKFGGGVSRFDKVSEVLELLEKTGAVKFKIEKRKIYVMNNINK
ncbi:putative anti-sigma factor [Pedobacter sp. BAL39]|nr:putative anti-sigma factor [Pedobacter sp. BAL39]